MNLAVCRTDMAITRGQGCRGLGRWGCSVRTCSSRSCLLSPGGRCNVTRPTGKGPQGFCLTSLVIKERKGLWMLMRQGRRLVETLKESEITEQDAWGSKRGWCPDRWASDWRKVKGRKGMRKKALPFIRKIQRDHCKTTFLYLEIYVKYNYRWRLFFFNSTTHHV